MHPKVEIDPEDGLLIEWPDGHQSRYPFAELRGICPCAACRDERDRSGSLRVIASPSPDATRLQRWDQVGNYAVALLWGDGHSTGIYSWEYLRERCGCVACRMARQREDG